MEQTNYDVDYFIKKFEAIPEEKWCVGGFVQGNKHCAMGFCDLRSPSNAYLTNKGIALTDIFSCLKLTRKANANYTSNLYVINDGESLQYPQPTPKQRILAALYDIKRLQQPKWKDITSDLAVLPVSETSDISITFKL